MSTHVENENINDEPQNIKDVNNIQNENNNKIYDENNTTDQTDYLTSDDESEDDTDNESDDESDLIPNLSLKKGSSIFIINVDQVPTFYTKNLKDARERMWDLARIRRNRETNYHTYIRGCSDKNRIEIVGSYKMSIFSVDRAICWLHISRVQEVVQDIIPSKKETPPKDKTIPEELSPPKLNSPAKNRGFFW
jgi:hypothetical protein